MKKLDRKSSKLNLKAETVQQLTQHNLKQVAGGAQIGATRTCGCIDTFACME
jgi:natural product precursor